ncbi:hypothetical protein [Corynebacterium jeikeium]|uniref:hypothetical protein n=1 Tax=Corynebacterium jeikeium TaxID=38289 RepID=UPI000A69A41E|nr:hypothetical protein [Corynebacterium jeikeium]
MATINGSLASVNSVPTEGTVLLRALELRPGSTFAVTGEPKVAVIKGGRFTIENVEPGPVQLTIQGNGVTHDVRVDVPDEADVDFLDLLDNVYEWEPEQVSAVKKAAREARKAADEAGRIASAFRGAEQLEGWAESASSSADAAGKSAKSAASSAGAARSDASAAKADAGKAATSASAAKTSADNAGKSATAADGSATAADKSRSDASSFANSAKSASESATASAQAAADSASAAKADAGKAATSATGASDSAKAAKADADRAKVSADSASSSASGAKGSADAAKGAADAAGKSASAAASSAGAAKADAGKAATSATGASDSAKAAKAEADRAVGVVDSVQWDGDRLTVAGKTSPSLRGEKGDKGEPGESGASTWDTVTGKPAAFPPEAHKHKMADISDLPKVSPYGDPNTIMQRSSSGHAILNANATPTSIAHVTHKKYVDDRDAATLAEARALVGSRPAFFSGSGAPPSSIPGAVVGDYYLDETTMELHKITGV